MKYCAVIDIGKTNVKVHVVDESLQSRLSRSRSNKVIQQGIYPHFDTHALWRWIRNTLAEIAEHYRIDAISITTHGATAALVHPDAGEAGLVLPVMDYEFEGVESESDYLKLRPSFRETFSPALPAGLNLGRQLFWQSKYCERAFRSAVYILPYPQYWAWRLTGVAVSEVTSWGCHTDLWSPLAKNYSALVDRLDIRGKLAPLVSADTMIGYVSESIAEQTGLPRDCQVFAGVHDSNASYLRYLSLKDKAEPSGSDFTVISTGTWVVCFSSATPLNQLDESLDMLANVDINGNAVACARFMGGREFDLICQRTGSKPEDGFSEADLQQVIDESVVALPDFSDGSGPFGSRRPEIRGRAENGAALASLYCALMLDYELDILGSSGRLIIEGAWLRNDKLCRLLAQLRPRQSVMLSSDETGTVSGSAQLAFGQGNKNIDSGRALVSKPLGPLNLNGLDEYRRQWREVLAIGAPISGQTQIEI